MEGMAFLDFQATHDDSIYNLISTRQDKSWKQNVSQRSIVLKYRKNKCRVVLRECFLGIFSLVLLTLPKARLGIMVSRSRLSNVSCHVCVSTVRMAGLKSEHVCFCGRHGIANEIRIIIFVG